MAGDLVSIIIPCYNAERWIRDTIQSCLNQTYRPIEIIVVDDGSTDNSLTIIKHYAERYPDLIRCESRPNQGAPAARNRGFELSRGQYIQWLDADDILAPDKLRHQVPILQDGKADVVTGWWRYLIEEKPGRYVEGHLRKPSLTEEAVASVFTNEGWSPSNSYLMTRAVVEAAGGWNESLTCMQDVDFIVRVAMTGVCFTVVPHLCGYYRRPLQPTLSTRDRAAFISNCFWIYEQVFSYCERTGWTDERRRTLVKAYGHIARYYFEHDRRMFERCLARIYQLDPSYVPENPHRLRWLSKMIGYRNAEQVALWYRHLKRKVL